MRLLAFCLLPIYETFDGVLCLGDSMLENVLKSIDYLGILFGVVIDDG